jgi:hypothetical protein
LFPVFHEFESGYRSRVAAWMENHYGTSIWWSEVLVALKNGNGYMDFKGLINGKRVSSNIFDAIGSLLRSVDGIQLERNRLAAMDDGFHLLQLSTLSDLEKLMFEHWTDFSKTLPSKLANGNPLNKEVFKGMFRRVREARNDCYHHKEVAKRHEIVSNAEQLLVLIGVHLETACDMISMSAVKPLRFDIDWNATCGPQLPKNDHQLEVLLQGVDKPVLETRPAWTTGDAIAKALSNLNADQRGRLIGVSIVRKEFSSARET